MDTSELDEFVTEFCKTLEKMVRTQRPDAHVYKDRVQAFFRTQAAAGMSIEKAATAFYEELAKNSAHYLYVIVYSGGGGGGRSGGTSDPAMC